MPFAIASLLAVASALPTERVEMTPDEIADHLLRVRERHGARHAQSGRLADPPMRSTSVSPPSAPSTRSPLSSDIDPLTLGLAVYAGVTVAEIVTSAIDSGSWTSPE